MVEQIEFPAETGKSLPVPVIVGTNSESHEITVSALSLLEIGKALVLNPYDTQFIYSEILIEKIDPLCNKLKLSFNDHVCISLIGCIIQMKPE